MSGQRFTIALPVRNGGDYLRPCVESILAQTCGDFELAILDNASTDGTTEWLTTLRDERVRLYPADRPLSITENWARIKTIPKNEFLTTIGHDDLLDPNFLEVISGLICEYPDAGLYMTHFRIINEGGKFLRHCRPMPARETAAEFLAARLSGMRDSFGTGHVLRSVTYDALGGIPLFHKLLYADDALFLQAIGNSYRATAFREAFSYRSHAMSAASESDGAGFFKGLEQYADLLTTLRKNDIAINEVLARYFADHAALIGQRFLNSAFMEAYQERRPPDPTVRVRISAAVARFTGDPPEETNQKPADTLLERATISRVYRTAFQARSIGRRLHEVFTATAKRLLAQKKIKGRSRLSSDP
jgi:glycosyltransferase involved in cell wall biosynthesis